MATRLSQINRLILLVVFLALGAIASAQDRGDLEQRWRGKSDAERTMLRKRFEQLQQLTPEQREKLKQGARHLRDVQEDLRDHASAEERAAAGKLPPDHRDRFWRDRALEKSRTAGKWLRDKLPPELIERLERAPASERRSILHAFHEAERGRRSRFAIGDLGRRLGLSRERIEELAALPVEQRLAVVVGLKRQHIEKQIRRNGLPPGVSEERWKEALRLSDEDFIELFHRIRERTGPPPGRGRFPRGNRPPGPSNGPGEKPMRRPGSGRKRNG